MLGCFVMKGFSYLQLLYSTDINECLTNNGGCDHTCINTEGSFECLCNTSYILAADNKTCVLNVTDCDYALDKPSGRITTSGFPNSSYAPNSNCTWIIDLPAYKSIELKFIKMDIEESPDCVKDRVTILNGKDKDALSLGSYCGNKLPDIIYSSTETVIIKFTSNNIINNKGFDLQYRGLKERSKSKLMQKNISNVIRITVIILGIDATLYHIVTPGLLCLLFHQNIIAELIVYTTFFQELSSHSCIWILWMLTAVQTG